jgi:hypothetical protein
MAARRTSLALILLLVCSSVSFAQGFKEWHSKQDRFSANFPGEPTVTAATWETEHGARVPARVYTATLPGPRTFSVTVVDYNPVKDLLIAKAKACPDQTDERCTGHTSFAGAGYWKTDVRGAMIHAAFTIMQRDVKVTRYWWSFLGAEAIESNEMQYRNNKDQSRGAVTIYMHHNWLYIMEETAPANYPPPALFVQSVALFEEDGNQANHDQVYFNGPTVDPAETNQFKRGPNGRVGGGGGRGGQNR